MISRDAETTPEMQRCLKTPVNGVSRHHRVGPVGLEPTTYGLKIWPLARTSVTCHHLADFPTVKGKMEFQIALS